MAWYTAGTVTITNGATSVAGTGTKFASNARVGDAFRGPDGLWYEVINIASETTLGIFPAYQSATATNSANYTIAPMQGYVKESADKLRSITNQYGTTLSLLGVPSDVSQLRLNIGAAKSGVNSDITQLTGLTTALSIAQGGTGGNTATIARTNLGLGTSATQAATLTQTAGSATMNLPTDSQVRVSEAGFAVCANSGFITTTTSGINIDTLPNGWRGLVAASGSNNTGTMPPFAGTFFWLETQSVSNNSAAIQMAYRYGGTATSGSALSPTMAIRVRNTAGTAWGPWGTVKTDQDVVISTRDTTAGQLLTVGYCGLGMTTGNILPDLDSPTNPNGTFGVDSSTLGTKPGGQTWGTVVISGRNNVVGTFGRVVQTFYLTDELTAKTWSRNYHNNAWGRWFESSPTGVGLAITDTPTTLLDIDAITTPSGFYRTQQTTTAGTFPSGASAFGTILVERYSATNLKQTLTPNANVGGGGRTYTRSYNQSTASWTTWVLTQTNATITGTVSGTYTAPTGAIIERGSNTNGEYTKFADGTMICSTRLTFNASSTVSISGVFRTAGVQWNYPASFVTGSSPVLSTCVQGFTAISANTSTVNLTQTTLFFVTATSEATAVDRVANVIAIGRWSA